MEIEPAAHLDRRRPGSRQPRPASALLLIVLSLLVGGCFGDDPPAAPGNAATATLSKAQAQKENTGPTSRLQNLTPAAPTPSPTLVPFAGDPVAPVTASSRGSTATRYFTETGHLLGGDFLSYYRNTSNADLLFGLPLTEEFAQRLPTGVYRVQYFERARMEYHPELPYGQRVQLGALGPVVLSGRTFDRLPTIKPTASRTYFGETGHTISNGFLSYWRANGGLKTFGYPLSEEIGEDGMTVQYFERARMEYHPGLEGTGYAVQLSPIGYYALKSDRFNLPMGLMVRINPPVLAEGHSAVVEVAATEGMTVTGEYEGRSLLFK
ncbi:MAG TPA: hypothetical protein VM409_05150, partial [Chloroflexia bacterium]|nr:hypothetical protein [Chloroflexia bacterium]